MVMILRIASSRIVGLGDFMPPYGDFCHFEPLSQRRLFSFSSISIFEGGCGFEDIYLFF